MRGLFVSFLPVLLVLINCARNDGDSNCLQLKSAVYDTLNGFSSDDGLMGYENKDGEVIIAPVYQLLFTDPLVGSLAFVVDGGRIIGIDRSGNELITPFIYENGPDYIREGLFRFVENGLIGFADQDGNIRIAAEYTFVRPFSNCLSAFCDGCSKKMDGEHKVYEGGKWGFINQLGEVVIMPRYDAVGVFKDGKVKVILKGKSMVLDDQGNKIS
ncbi:MAG TPA: WG repeat-containing protein [Cyclobacteriaceae bacterium]